MIPDSVTSIGWAAFSCCGSLESLIIPESVTSIGMGTFNACFNLQTIVFENPNGWSATDANDDTVEFLSEELCDAERAAAYLCETYCQYDWNHTEE